MLMNIVITRRHFLPNCTIGSLEVVSADNPTKWVRFCETLEPHAINWHRERKIQGKTAIPCGQYKIKYRVSKKFRQKMPFLEDIPHFEGVMLHAGNYPKDTEGCILVGNNPTTKNGVILPMLNNSRRFFTALDNMIAEAIYKNGEEVTVTIREIREINK